MKHPQIINTLEDAVITISNRVVIDDDDQTPLSDSISAILVDIVFFDITTGASLTTMTDVSMNYDSAANIWVINLIGTGTPADIKSTLVDRHKYTARVTDAGSNNMREFQLSEFAVDNDSFEAVWMRLPYQVEIGPTDAWIKWYNVGDIGGTPIYQAEAYEGGTGTTYATSANRVTHRGEVTPVPPGP